MGLAVFIFFQTRYGMPSGPGAEEGEHLLRACLISSKERGAASLCGESLPLDGGGGLGGKKC